MAEEAQAQGQAALLRQQAALLLSLRGAGWLSLACLAALQTRLVVLRAVEPHERAFCEAAGSGDVSAAC